MSEQKKRPKSIDDGHKILVILTKEQVEKAKFLGGGNVSAGIRAAIDSAGKPA